MACEVPFSAPIRKGVNAGAPAPVLRSCLIWLIFAAKLYCGAFLTLGSDYLDAEDIINARREWKKESPSADIREFLREADWGLAKKLDPRTGAFRRCGEESWIDEADCPSPDCHCPERSAAELQKFHENRMALTKEVNECFETSPGANRLEKQILGQSIDFAEVMELLGQFIKRDKVKFGHPLHESIDMEAATPIFKKKYNCGIIVFPMRVVPVRSTAERTGKAPKPSGVSPHDDKYNGWFTFYLSKVNSKIIKVEMTFQPTHEDFRKGTSWTYSGTFKFVPSGKLTPLYYCGNFTDELGKTRPIGDPATRMKIFGDEDLIAKIEERKKFKSGRLVDSEENCSLQSRNRLDDDRLAKEMKWKRIDRLGKYSPTRSFDGRVSNISKNGQLEERLISIIGIEGERGLSRDPNRYCKRAEVNVKFNNDETFNVFREEKGYGWDFTRAVLRDNGRKRHKVLLSRKLKRLGGASWNDIDLNNICIRPSSSCPMGHLVSILYYEPRKSKAVKRAETNQEKNAALMPGNDDQPKNDSPSASNRFMYSGIFLVTIIAAFAAAALLKSPHRQLRRNVAGLKGNE